MTTDRAESIRRILGKLEAYLLAKPNCSLGEWLSWAHAVYDADLEAALDRSLRDFGVRAGESAGCGHGRDGATEICDGCMFKNAPSATPREPGGGATDSDDGPSPFLDDGTGRCLHCGETVTGHIAPAAVTGAGVGKGED